MGGLAGFLTALIPVVVRMLMIRMGIGLLSYAAVIAAINAMLNQAKAAWMGLPADVVAYMALGGVNQALAIVAGAIMGRVAMIPAQRFGLI